MSSPKSTKKESKKQPFYRTGLQWSMWFMFVSLLLVRNEPQYFGLPGKLVAFVASMFAGLVFTSIWLMAVMSRRRELAKNDAQSKDASPVSEPA